MNLKMKLPLTITGVLAALMARRAGRHPQPEPVGRALRDRGQRAARARARRRRHAGHASRRRCRNGRTRCCAARIRPSWTSTGARSPSGGRRRRQGQGAARHAAGRARAARWWSSSPPRTCKMGVDYRKGFDAFKAAEFESAAGDAAVAGMDREPARLLGESGKKIAADSAAVSASAAAAGAARDARQHRADAGGRRRRHRRRHAGSAAGSRGRWTTRCSWRDAIADGDLTTQVKCRGDDEIAQLLKALSAMQGSLSGVVGNVRSNSESVADGRQRRSRRAANDLSAAHRGTGVGAAADRRVDGAARLDRAPERRERAVGQPARARRQHRGAQGRRGGRRGRRDDEGHQRQLAGASSTSSA